MSQRDIRAGVDRLFRIALRRPEKAARDADDELDAMLEARVEHLVARGMTPDEAHIEARRRLGASIDETRDRLHHSAEHREKRMRFKERTDELLQDIRFTMRSLSRSPGFAMTAILVAALGIGANTAAFSVADFVLLRPLPFREPQQLVKLWNEFSPPNYRDWQKMNTVYESMGAFHPTGFNMTGRGEPQRLTGVAVTSDLLPLFGVQPTIGRLIAPAEERTAVLSYALWQQAFGGDSSAVGKAVVLDGAPYVVVGVMPPEFRFPSREITIWTPMPADEISNDERDNNWFEVVGRLKPGKTLQDAQTEIKFIAARLAREYAVENEGLDPRIFALRDGYSQQSKLLLIALCGAAVCVLLLSCANLAGLLIARSLSRRKEMDVRIALGAGRGRLVRQLLTESLVIATLGGGLGIALAVVSVPLLSRLVPFALPISNVPTVDVRVLLFAVLITALTGIGIGVFPAIRATGQADLSALREGARSGGGQRVRLRSALVIAEVTASVVLLVSAGLLMRALDKLTQVDPGFRPDNVLTLRTPLSFPPYDITERRIQFYTRVLDGVRALPGVTGAGYITGLPMSMTGGIRGVKITGQPAERWKGTAASLRYATPGYLSAMAIPMRKGRDIEETDALKTPFVAVVSESFVQRYFPNDDPIGKRFNFAESDRTIVGVAGDVRVRGIEQPSEPQVYLSYKQVPDSQSVGYIPKDLVIRFASTSGSSAALTPAVRRIIHEADVLQPISQVRMLREIVSGQTAARAVQVRVIGAFAVIAFLLAAVGIHGLLAYTVSERRHEFSVRMALGAQRGAIVGMVMRQGLMLAVAGVVPGVMLAYAAGRAMSALLAGVAPSDAVTFIVASALCLLMTLAGSFFPVVRAVNVDPASAFRAE